MELLIADEENESFSSLYDDRPAGLGVITAGASLPVTVSLLKRIRELYDSKLFTPIDLTGWTIRAALGGGFVLPVDGTWPIVFTDSDDVQHMSDSVIPANPTSDEIQFALNSITEVADIGGATVQGQNGFYSIRFNQPGAVEILTGFPGYLIPLSLLIFERSTQGDDDTNEVQTLRIVQNVGAIASLTADSASSTITQTNLVVGDGTHNAKIRVTLPENRYGGTWSVTKGATVINNLGWSDNEAQIQAALQASLGAGNVLVTQANADSYDLTFAGSLGLQAITITLDGSGLLIRQTFSGELDTASVGVAALLQDRGSAILTLEIEGAPAGEDNRKLFQADVEVRSPVMRPESIEV